MKQYIERALANDALIDSGLYGNVLEKAVNAICSVPAADVRPVVRGEVLCDTKHMKATCSVCGCEYILVLYKETTHLTSPVNPTINMHFCPNCGAYMRKEERNENK